VTTVPGLILASTSRYRRELLERFRLPFEVRSPEVEESPIAGEAPEARARRLSLAKAQAVAASYPERVVIGADQVAACEGAILDKPGDAAVATAQLRTQSGRSVEFFSAVAVVWAQRDVRDVFVDQTSVRLRTLTDPEIAAYLRLDEPYDCAGSLRSEALGTALCESIRSADPTGLLGLPLIRLAASLRACGFALP
jgi:septum formation protein